MAGFRLSAFFGSLFFLCAQLGATPALAQKSSLLPSVPNLVPKVDLPILPPIRVPDVAKIVPPLKAEVGVPSIGGLTPSLNVRVNTGTGPVLDVGVTAGSPATGLPPAPDVHAPLAGQIQHLGEKRLELVPTCR